MIKSFKKIKNITYAPLATAIVLLAAIPSYIYKLKKMNKTRHQSTLTVFKNTFKLRAFAFFKIPLLSYIKPVVEEVSSERCIVRVPLKRRNKNHLNSMYFGVLACGADCATGLIAMKMIDESKHKLSLVFKDFKADFLQRPESDVYFICEDIETIKKIVETAIETGERVSLPVKSYAATSPGGEPVAKFELTLSLKKRK